MRFICTLDAIFELASIVGELFGHFVNPAWHIATDSGHEDHALTDMEFMGHTSICIVDDTGKKSRWSGLNTSGQLSWMS